MSPSPTYHPARKRKKVYKIHSKSLRSKSKLRREEESQMLGTQRKIKRKRFIRIHSLYRKLKKRNNSKYVRFVWMKLLLRRKSSLIAASIDIVGLASLSGLNIKVIVALNAKRKFTKSLRKT